MSWYHCVFRPQLELLPELDSMENWFKSTCVEYLISEEKGSSKGEEKFNHYDVVFSLKKEKREDSIKRALCNSMEIPKENRRNIKVYKMQEEKRLYYIGYCLKEQIAFRTNIDEKRLNEGKEEFKRIGIKVKENFKEDFWSLDDCAYHYIKFLDGLENDPTYYRQERMVSSRQFFDLWLKENRARIKFSVYQKINEEKFTKYCGI